LWHVAQVPATIPEWLNTAAFHVFPLWQVSHDCVVGTCVAGITVAVMREPAL